LAWTPTGGEVIFVEAAKMPGKNNELILTGKLGDVMQESARIALSYVEAYAESLGLDGELEKDKIHLHIPSGAVPKDGPSAGITLVTALVSLLSGRTVRSDVAMTGEVTLQGQVLPIGGVKLKVMAAHRAGLEKVLLPKLNEIDIEDIPEAVRDDMEIILVEDIQDVLENALEPLEQTEMEEAKEPIPEPEPEVVLS
jgi:ATP-dependent Lon protease